MHCVTSVQLWCFPHFRSTCLFRQLSSRISCLAKRIADNEELVYFDVVSLFTSIPVKLATDVVKTKLRQSDGWKETTILTKTQVTDLLEFALSNNYVTYQGMHASIWLLYGVTSQCSDCRSCHGQQRETSLVHLSSCTSLMDEECGRLQRMLDGKERRTFPPASELYWRLHPINNRARMPDWQGQSISF